MTKNKQIPISEETATSKWQGNPANICRKCVHCLPAYIFPNGVPKKIHDTCFILARQVTETNKCLHFRPKKRR